ncbi:MAG: FHA domain-containing protein [Deltaproteobacteria bacterium]|nr:FHA domain-containing protein [Deltaproteobacteria bacterium]
MPTSLTTRENASFAFLFFDIVKYSLLAAHDQLEAVEVLKDLVLNGLDSNRVPRGDSIILPTGDGLAIALPQDLAAVALNLAISIQTRFCQLCAETQSPMIRFRIGLHVGEVYISHDINGNSNIIGHGINQAQRIMDFGDSDHILCSAAFRDLILGTQPELEPVFIDASYCYDKNGSAYEVWNVVGKHHDADFGNPAPPPKGKPITEAWIQDNDATQLTSMQPYSEKASVIDSSSCLTSAQNLAEEWGHPYVGLEHMLAVPFRRDHPVSCFLEDRMGIKSKYFLSVLRDQSWTGRLKASWPGRPLTPAVVRLWQSLYTNQMEELVSLILDNRLSLPVRLIRELNPKLDIQAIASELWPQSADRSKPLMENGLQVCNGPEDGRLISLSEDVLTIGRAPDNVLAVPYDSTVSGRHARVFFRNGQCWIEDLGSKNGLAVNGRRITSAVPVKRDDYIKIGQIILAVL